METANRLKFGPVTDFSNFMGAVIDATAFKRISGFIEEARAGTDTEILAGGKCDDR